MKRLFFLSVLLPALIVQGCSSTKINGKVYEKDETLSTLNDRSQPDWADESNPFVIRSGKAYSVGVTTIHGDERPEAGMRISENNARANFAKAIENRMEFIFQNSEENVGMDSNQARYIGSEVSSLTTHSMTVEGHWYKRYAQSNDDGVRRILYKIYSLVSMPESDLKRAINDSIAGRVHEKKLSESFQEKVDKQWDRFVEAKPTEKSTEVKESEVKQEIKKVPDQAVQSEELPQIKKAENPIKTVVSEAVLKDSE